jgi:predicted dehydrogenase
VNEHERSHARVSPRARRGRCEWSSWCIDIHGAFHAGNGLEGFEPWLNSRGVWEVVPEAQPSRPWTSGLQHLVECAGAGRQTVNRPEHACHALEVMLAAKRSAAEGRVVEIASSFPALDYTSLAAGEADDRRTHDPRGLV